MTIILPFLTIIIVKKTMISYIILEVNFHMKSRLKELRARHGWNQSELARRATICHSLNYRSILITYLLVFSLS